MSVSSLVVALLSSAAPVVAATAQESAPKAFEVEHMAGVWGTETVFGPEVSGRLVLREEAGTWRADVQGHVADVVRKDGEWFFELPGDRGSFRGTVAGDSLHGFWYQPRGTVLRDRHATPVTLTRTADGAWAGEVSPLPERISLYFEFAAVGDELMARMRNPEKNIGVFYNLGKVELEDGALRLFDTTGENVLLKGRLAASGDRWSVDLDGGGATLELRRRSRDGAPGYYPGDSSRSPYAYRLPVVCDDGWQTAAPSDVGLKKKPLEALVQSVLDTRYEERTTPYIHSVLVARRGKLVLDEYFHGYHRGRTHDTRSSGKTLTAIMTGIAMDQGASLKPESAVLEVFADADNLQHVDKRKRALTVHHLLSMQSGFDCDDNSWDTPGNEDRMQSQDDQPDWIRYALDLPMVREPGESGVYCTAGINLLGGVVERATGVPTLDFFDEFYARPLGIQRYHMNLDPLDRGYMGGGMRLRPRDHMKLGQLLASKGRWGDRQVVSAEWIETMSAAHSSLYTPDDYGYGTWRRVLSHEGKDYQAIYASGNGGQFVIAIPSEEIVVLFSAGNYMDFGTWSGFLNDLVPRHVLAAIQD